MPPMTAQCFDSLLPDDEMRVHLERGETFSFKLPKWHAIERQIDRLGFEDLYFVSEVDSLRGKLIKVTPAGSGQALRSAA